MAHITASKVRQDLSDTLNRVPTEDSESFLSGGGRRSQL
jgi:hypothetical protein